MITTLELPVQQGNIILPSQYRAHIKSVTVSFSVPREDKATKKMTYHAFLGKYPPVQEDADAVILSEKLTKKYV